MTERVAVHNCVLPASHSGRCIPMTEADKLRNGEWAVVRKDDLRWLMDQVRDGYLPDPDAPTYNRLLEAI